METIGVIIVVLVAGAYVLRRIVTMANGSGSETCGCAGGCGGCAAATPEVTHG